MCSVMPRVNRKRKNTPQRKPKTIKFNQNEIESEMRKATEIGATAVGVVEIETAQPTAEPSSVADVRESVVAEDAINQAHVMSDEIAAEADGGVNSTLEEDDIIAVDDKITSKLSQFLSLSLPPSFSCI